jgi:PAS domain S-box-containing protein
MALRLQPQSIRAELALIVVVLALPLVALIAYGIYRDAGREQTHAQDIVWRMAESTADSAARFVEDARLLLEPIARRPLVRAMDPERCDPGLKDLLELHPRAGNFLVVDRMGRIICGAIPPPRDRVVRIQDEGLLRLIIETGRFGLSRPLVGRINGRWTVGAVQPVIGGDGTVAGAVSMSIDLLEWRPLPAPSSLPQGAIAALVTAEGIVIARSEDAAGWIGRNASDGDIMQRVLELQTGTARARGADDQDRIWGFRAVPGTNWYALSGILTERVLGPVFGRARRDALLLALAVGSVLILALFASRRLSTPIGDIVAAMRRRSQGEQSVRAPVRGPREIAAVAIELNRRIEERERAERTLRESEERFRALWETAPDAILMIDEASVIRYAGPAVLEVFGYRPEELVGQNLTVLQPAELAVAHRASVARYLRTGEKRLDWRSTLTTGRRKDGSELPVEVSFGELRLGGQRYFAGFVRDVSERQRMARERDELLARMQMQLDRMPLACVVLDADLRVSYANAAAERTFGWSAAEMIGRSATQLYVPPERSEIVEDIFLRLRRGEYVSAAGESVRKDGVRIALEWVNTPLVGRDGEFLGLMSMATDVSERLRAERRLELTQRLFAALSEVNETVVRVREREELFHQLCRICVERMGFLVAFVGLIDTARRHIVPRVCAGPGSSVVREHVFPLDPADALASTVTSTAVRTKRAAVANDVDAEPARAAARPIRERIGSRSTASFPLFQGGEVIGAITVHSEAKDFFDDAVVELLTRMADDISFALDKLDEEDKLGALARELEERVRRRTAELEAANLELEAFSYSVSHDLRAPVRHVDGFVRLLEKELASPNAKAAHYLATIAAAAQRMGALIDDLLTLSRTGRQTLELRRVDLGAMLRELIRELSAGAGERGVQWKIDELPEVMADASLLRIVLHNLLSNALKYSRAQTPARIAVEARAADPGIVEITVRDNGVGFDARFKDKLFGVFQRLHREEEFEGTGIGLATARRIVHRHGHRIWAAGELGKGAAFTFTLTQAEVAHAGSAHFAG